MSAFLSPSPTPLILLSSLAGCGWAYYQYTIIDETKLEDLKLDGDSTHHGKENARLYGGSSMHGSVTHKNLEVRQLAAPIAFLST